MTAPETPRSRPTLTARRASAAARARAAADSRARDLELHVAAGRALLRAEDEPALFAEFCRALVDRGAKCAWVGLASDDGRIHLVAREGDDRGYLAGLEVHWADSDVLGNGPTGRAFRGGRPIVADDLATDPSVEPWRGRQLAAGLRSSAGIPLIAEGRTLGVITAYWDRPWALSAESLASLERVAGDLARGILAIRRRREINASRERLQRVIDASPNAVLLVDGAARIVYANPEAGVVFGAPVDRLDGRPIDDLVPVDDVERHRASLETYLVAPAARRMGRRPGIHARRVDGTSFPADISLGPLILDGEPHVVVTVTDRTEHERLEAGLLQAQKMEVMGQVANILAHDFRNYLSVIGGFAALIADGLPADDPNLADTRQIEVAVREATELIRNVLAFARPVRDVLGTASVAAVLADATPLVDRLAGPNVRVRVDVADGLPDVGIDPALLGQVLMNLATNARDAMPDGGELAIEARAEDEAVVIDVRDTGPGIDAAVAGHLFEPFGARWSGKDGAAGGAGLGLASVRMILDRVGGSVAVASTSPAGTTFRIRIPAAPAAG